MDGTWTSSLFAKKLTQDTLGWVAHQTEHSPFKSFKTLTASPVLAPTTHSTRSTLTSRIIKAALIWNCPTAKILSQQLLFHTLRAARPWTVLFVTTIPPCPADEVLLLLQERAISQAVQVGRNRWGPSLNMSREPFCLSPHL